MKEILKLESQGEPGFAWPTRGGDSSVIRQLAKGRDFPAGALAIDCRLEPLTRQADSPSWFLHEPRPRQPTHRRRAFRREEVHADSFDNLDGKLCWLVQLVETESQYNVFHLPAVSSAFSGDFCLDLGFTEHAARLTFWHFGILARWLVAN